METTYRSQLSPYQPKLTHPIDMIRKQNYNVQDKKHPVRESIEKCLGTHTIKAVVEEDQQTLSVMQTDGLISFLCTLTKDGRVLSQGRGSTIIGPTNKFFGRAISCAFNSAFSDAAIRASKVLDLILDRSSVIEQSNEPEPATDKQKDFLRKLVSEHVKNEGELTWWMNKIETISKADASSDIKSFAQ